LCLLACATRRGLVGFGSQFGRAPLSSVLPAGDEGGNLGANRRVLQASLGHGRQSGQRRIADDRPALLSLRLGRAGAAKAGTITNQHLIGLLLSNVYPSSRIS